MNKVNLIGRLGSDPEIKYPTNKDGKAFTVASFNLAIRRDKEVSDWITCKAMGAVADLIGKYVSKGHMVGVSGSIQQESWKDKEGGNKSRLVVMVQDISLLPNKDVKSVPVEVVSEENIPF